MWGIVVRNTGSFYTVRCDRDGKPVDCKVKGNFKLLDIDTTNPIAVGDRVRIEGSEIDIAEGRPGVICEIAPRRNYIIRKSSNLSKQAHILAANVDRALLMTTVNYPVTTTTFIDRFLSTAEAYNVPTTIVFNKIDRYNEQELAEMHALATMYREVGYRVLSVSALTGEGMEALWQEVQHGITLLSGHSGVGKSTVINLLSPGAEQKTAEISATHHTGMHTTTFSSMIPIADTEGAYLIDTPGIKGFGVIEYEKKLIGHYFPEIFRVSERCRFNNCTHIHEPGCAVVEAVKAGHIAQSRYKSYLSLYHEDEEEKYRKPF